MKKKIWAFAFILSFAGGIAKADTTTTRLGLTKPTLSSTNWGPKLNTNADIIDNNVALISSTNSFTYYQTFSSGTFTDKLGVGGAPTNKFDVMAGAPSDTAVTSKITNTDSGYTVFIASANSTFVDMRAIGSGATGNWTTGIPAANLATIALGTSRGLLGAGTTLYHNTTSTDPIIFRVNNTEEGRITTNGYFGPIVGTVDGSSAASGSIGEVISTTTAGTVNYTSSQYVDVVAITLTAGTWNIDVFTYSQANGATITDHIIGLGTASGNSSSGFVNMETNTQATVMTATNGGIVTTIPAIIKRPSGTTTYYLKAYSSFSAATPNVQGRITARRIY